MIEKGGDEIVSILDLSNLEVVVKDLSFYESFVKCDETNTIEKYIEHIRNEFDMFVFNKIDRKDINEYKKLVQTIKKQRKFDCICKLNSHSIF